MKKWTLTVTALVCAVSLAAQPRLSHDSIDEVLAVMTLEEKAEMLVGAEWKGSQVSAQSLVMGDNVTGRVPGAAGFTVPIPRLGIPGFVVADGTAGLRINPAREGTEKTFYCTAFPVGTLLSSSWDTALVEAAGAAMGEEVREYGVDALLGPGINIMRSPLCGRNFEYYSEDPCLTGKIAAAMIRGIQSRGVGTSLKHFAVNNQETNRPNLDAQADDRTVREIYLRGFEIAVKEGRPWTIMSANNYLNGVHTSESPYLLTDILRGEWGFDGVVMTDWLCGVDPVAQVAAGNDLLMPGLEYQKDELLKAMQDGRLSMEDVDRDVRRILELVMKSPVFQGYAYSNEPNLEAHAAVARRSAAEGMVLLENSGALPLGKEVRRIALFGNTSYDFIRGGSGSAAMAGARTVSFTEAILEAGYVLDEGLRQAYEAWIRDKRPVDNGTFKVLALEKRAPEMVPEASLVEASVRAADAVIFTLGRSSGEGHDRSEKDNFLLTDSEKKAIASISVAAHRAGKPFIVILNIGGVIETASWKDAADALLLSWQGGQEGAPAVVDILSGKVNPSGKLPMTFGVHLSDYASSANFPQDAEDYPVAFSPLWKHTPYAAMIHLEENTGRPNIDFTRYEEGIWVGYRDFEHFGKPVSYPFGYGLSYTSFQYGRPRITHKDGKYTVTLKVKNTGKVAGKEVVQLYLSAPSGRHEKPEKELRAFAKTALLAPGESERVTLTFTDYDLASFDTEARAWVADRGRYAVKIGSSSRDIRRAATFKLKDRQAWPVTKESPEIVESL